MSGLRIATITSAAALLTVLSVAWPRLMVAGAPDGIRAVHARNPAQSRFHQSDWNRVSPGPANRLEDPPQRLDLRGNEIARPVARYRVDDRGTLYEVHSPETQVPRLRAPTL